MRVTVERQFLLPFCLSPKRARKMHRLWVLSELANVAPLEVFADPVPISLLVVLIVQVEFCHQD